MKLFFLTFVAVYGGMHAYAFHRTRTALGFGFSAGMLLALFMLLMTFAPLLVRILENHEYELAARALAHGAYIWMALLFFFFFGNLAIDLSNLLTRILVWAVSAHLHRFLIPAKTAFLITAWVSIAATAYGYWDALNIRTERLTIETSKLPAGIERLRIVQITDVHLGLIVRCSRLENILRLVKAENPDLLVSTGDLVDAQINHLTGLAELILDIKPKFGKYAITGNHEFYAGLKQSVSFINESGFTLLRGERVDNGAIVIAGVDDEARTQITGAELPPVHTVLAGIPESRFTLLLKHRPVVDSTGPRLFDLQLSGHTHNGQLFPFNFFVKLAYPFIAGRYDLPNGSILYVSRGTGTWGPPVRVFSSPEITVIDLVRKTAL